MTLIQNFENLSILFLFDSLQIFLQLPVKYVGTDLQGFTMELFHVKAAR